MAPQKSDIENSAGSRSIHVRRKERPLKTYRSFLSHTLTNTYGQGYFRFGNVDIRSSMTPVFLEWHRFTTFLDLREKFRGKPCIYRQSDSDERILRVGESDDLWERYKGGTAYALEAAMPGSGNLFFAALAPKEVDKRKTLEARLIYEFQPPYNNQHKDYPPVRRAEYIHEGPVPKIVRPPI